MSERTAERRRARRTVAWGLAASLLSACAGSGGNAPLTFVATAPDTLTPRLLKQDVKAEWCFAESFVTVALRPPWRVRLADTGRAVTRAIDSVPGANVLTHVRMRTRIEQYLLFQRVCAIVIGDAGVVP